ncbi:MAG: hypothetical protein J6Y30_06230 [Treponema sp.]|nr:hypothetical protein [Treponema sp.]
MQKAKEIHAEFWKYAELGSGRAFLIFREHKELDFTREIIQLCLKNYSYDPQSEGVRSEYVMQFMRVLSESQREFVLASIKPHLKDDKVSDDWDCIHFYGLAAKLAHEFDPSFGELLRKRFDECDDETLIDAFPSSAVIELDGFDGMVRVARKFGKAFKVHDDWYHDDYYTICVPNMDGESVRAKLGELAESDQDIRSYLERIEECKKESEERKAEKEKEDGKSNFERVKNAFYTGRGHVPARYVKKLTLEESKYFADEMKTVKSQKELIKYLWIFSYIPYPYDAKDLLLWLSKRKNSYFNNCLVDALSLLASPEIRSLAEKALDSDEYSPFYLTLLKKNYRQGDGAKIAEKISRIKDFEDAHWDLIDLLAVCEKNLSPDCLEPLKIFYERTKCGLCRTNAAELMEKAGVLPQNIREELPFDSEILHDQELQ